MFAGSQFLEPDGWFPNHSPNPENKEAMAACTDAVNRSKVSTTALRLSSAAKAKTGRAQLNLRQGSGVKG